MGHLGCDYHKRFQAERQGRTTTALQTAASVSEGVIIEPPHTQKVSCVSTLPTATMLRHGLLLKVWERK